MELYDEPSKQCLRGYNDAHMFSMYEPVLLEDISPPVNAGGEYFDGFFDAKAHWHEQQIDHSNELSGLRDTGNEIDGILHER